MFNYVTVLKQLGGENKLRAMIGINSIGYDNDSKTVIFKFKGSRKANQVSITLNNNDLCDLDFFKGMRQVLVTKDIGCEELKTVFEKMTGLYLTI